MREVIRYSFLVVAVIAASSIFSVTEANGQNVINDILKMMENHNKSLQTVQANVRMQKYNPQLDTTDTYIGTTSYIPKTNPKASGRLYMRIDWTSKPVEHISIVGDDYRLYKPGIQTLYYGKVEKAKGSAAAGNAFNFMSMSREQLRANYNIQYVGNENIEGGVQTVRLLLTPKAAASYKTADLWVDGNGMPIQAKVTEKNNDTTTVLLTNIQKNNTISPKIFALDPKGVKKVPA